MKKIVSETIDGSMKDILQLKTLDNSLEYSQMYDALEDTPRDFQTKLIDALNSLAQTMGCSPEEAFNKVLCKSDDGNEAVKKKMYNWWRAFFEVLGKCEKVPTVRVSEFNQKIDDLMAEIMKAGDAEATGEEEPVMESDDEDLGYQQATKDDEDKMLADMDFAVQHIGEIANKVNTVVNFINPYCETTFNDENITMKKPGRYGIGDHVLYKGEECVVVDVDEDLMNDEEIYQVSKDSDKVGGLSFREWVTWDDLEPVEGFTEEVKNTMKFKKIDENRGGDSDEWVSMDDIVGMRVGESEGGLDDDEFKDSLMSMKHEDGDLFENYDVSNLDDGVVELNVLVNKPRVSYADVEQRYAPIAKNAGWKFVSFAYSDKDDTVVAGNDDMCAINVKFSRASNQLNEETTEMKNELKKGDDGWTEIGQPVGEANVVVDANDVWAVLELLDDETAKKNLTDLINSHLRTEDEIMDVIDSYVEVNWHGKVKKQELNKMFTDWMYVIVDDLGLDVDKYRENGEFVDEGKPTSVELEGTDWKDITEKLTAEELADSIEGWEDSSKKLVVCDAYASGSEIVNVDVLTVTDKRDEVMKMANDYLLGNVENWQVADASEPRKDENGQFYTELILEPKYEEVSENNDEVKSGDVKDGEKQVTQGGDTKTLVAGEEKKPVCEMTIEQEIDDPWKLYELLWGQGKENLRDLLESELVDEEFLMQCLEDMETHNLTSINDAFAFDFPTILDMLGLDGRAWSQNLEIKRKGDDSED